MGLADIRVVRWVVAGAAMLLVAGIVCSWPGIQDDALIHLRYADVLLRTHRISFDGRTASFGNSSVLYLWLLAGLRTATTSALLPRVVSSAAHGMLFVGSAVWLWPHMRERTALRPWGCLVLVVLALPSAVRWLDDGMETPLTLIAAALLGLAVASRWRPWWFVALGAVCVLLRVEMLLAVLLVAVLMVMEKRGPAVRSAVGLLAGGATGAGVIVGLTGHLLPDTAVAKAQGAAAWAGTLHASGEVFASALGFGAGLLLLWILTMVAALRRVDWRKVVVANCLFVVTLAGAAVRGQMIQGIRYFAWTLVFSIAWNVAAIARTEVAETEPVWGLGGVAAVLVGVLAVGAVGEGVLLRHVFQTRSELFTSLRSEHLERLRDLKTVAMDVGYIGYFTGAPVCDLAGLVNGRAAAKLSADGRTAACAAERPQMLFLNAFQMGGFAYHEDVSRWQVCGTYDFSNLHSTDVHYLAAAPEVAERVCAVTGETPRPLRW